MTIDQQMRVIYKYQRWTTSNDVKGDTRDPITSTHVVSHDCNKHNGNKMH